MKSSSLSLFFALAIALLPGGRARAEGSAVDQARSGEARQTQIQGDANTLAAELDGMLDEYQRNGIADDDTKAVKSLRTLLSTLSQEDMTRILHLLQAAAAKGDSHAAIQSISQAYAQQKGVVSQLKHVLADYEHGQEAEELSRQAKELAQRQAANFQVGLAAAQWSLDGKPQPQEEVDASLAAQTAEEKSIADEMKLLQTKVAELAKNPANAAMAERFKKGLDEMNQVSGRLDAAENGLGQKQLFSGVEQEKAASDQMREVARTIAPPRDAVEALQEAAENLDKAVNQQQGLNGQAQLARVKPIEQWATDNLAQPQSGIAKLFKQLGLDKLPLAEMVQDKRVQDKYKSAQNQAGNELATLENRQGELVEQDDELSQDLEPVAKSAADDVRSAIAPQREARTAISDRNTDVAIAAQQQALAAMQKAQTEVHQQLAAAEKARDQSADPVAQLRALQNQAQDLLKAQTALATATAAPATPQQAAANAQNEAALRDKAKLLAQQAAATDPAAAQSVAKASGNMQQAQTAMSNPATSPQAAPAQAAAIQNLARGAQQLGEQIAQAASAEAAAAAAQQALDGLNKIIAEEQQLQLDTVQKIGLQTKLTPNVTGLAPRQQAISGELKALPVAPIVVAGAANPAAPAPVAGQAASVAAHMDEAAGELLKGDGNEAVPAERGALDDLYTLQKNLEAQAANSDAAPTAEAQAASALAQAQAETAQAMTALGQGPSQTRQAAGQLTQAAATAGQAAAAGGPLPAGVQDAMRAATEALAAGAVQASARNIPKAEANAQAAAAALTQAQAALAQAQTLVSDASISGSGASAGAAKASGNANGPGAAPGSAGPGEGSTQDGGRAAGTAGGDSARKGGFLGLPARDRATIQQAQAEKYPQEYAAQVEQYLQNLSDESSRH